MVFHMENKSILISDKIQITPDIYIRIPTVREILEDESLYYNITYTLSSVPFQQMVQLDDMGIDYTTITDWELFNKNIQIYSYTIQEYKKNLSQLDPTSDEYIKTSKSLDSLLKSFNYVFGDLQIEGFGLYHDNSINEDILYNVYTDVRIDKVTYYEIAKTIRKINDYEYVKSKPGNESAKKYLLEKERRRLKSAARKPYEPYLEKIIVALVNTSEFPYNYSTCMDLTIYQFNQSFKQIQHKISFDKTMIGVYAGTVSTKDMADKSVLSWIKAK